ncbi:hypothetical protein PFICI_00257 [Pestalotiopsis fici W106-1]|uniref:Uncharacterized protein n=1 Tax=Pestalotiopsis fici (strain W106-1 / CGMCC3.15140) TaxID=1229662 RepID=W3XK85_PESFW|nr:uncharacterized protein PFICI_00257 [Pestalotiopsis fici W106-1]ETS86429.1 hypothetical protein PFICI_00257 [Pestalotiopsis fici W106-1]
MDPQAEFISSAIKDELTYEQRLFEFSMNSNKRELHFLAFRGLQRENILRLQNSLSMCKKKTLERHQFTEEHPGQLTQLLHDYSTFSY